MVTGANGVWGHADVVGRVKDGMGLKMEFDMVGLVVFMAAWGGEGGAGVTNSLGLTNSLVTVTA